MIVIRGLMFLLLSNHLLDSVEAHAIDSPPQYSRGVDTESPLNDEALLLSSVNSATPGQNGADDDKGIIVRNDGKRSHSPADRKRPARAADHAPIPDAAPKPWPAWSNASGDWWGIRSKLWKHGIIPELMYTAEVFSNLHGGIKTGTQGLGNLDITLTIHSEPLGLWSGGVLFVYVQNSVGKGISDSNVGNLLTISNIDPVPRFNWTQLSAFYYSQSWFSEKLALLLGKHDANNYFAVPVFAESLLNSAFDLTANVPMPTFPDPGLGVAIMAKPLSWLSLSAGVYNGNTQGNGNKAAFADIKGVFAISEWAVMPSFDGYAGNYRVGGWFNNNLTNAVTAKSTIDAAMQKQFNENFGFYLAMDQSLTQARPMNINDQGLGLFFQFGWAPQDRNETTVYIGGGLSYTGLFPGRSDDVTGLGIGHAKLSGQLFERTSETILEFSYLAELTPWFSMQPDMQYVINPSGKGRNALIIGMRIEVAF